MITDKIYHDGRIIVLPFYMWIDPEYASSTFNRQTHLRKECER